MIPSGIPCGYGQRTQFRCRAGQWSAWPVLGHFVTGFVRHRTAPSRCRFGQSHPKPCAATGPRSRRRPLARPPIAVPRPSSGSWLGPIKGRIHRQTPACLRPMRLQASPDHVDRTQAEHKPRAEDSWGPTTPADVISYLRCRDSVWGVGGRGGEVLVRSMFQERVGHGPGANGSARAFVGIGP